VAGCCGCANEPLGSVKGWKCLDIMTVVFLRRTVLHGVSFNINIRNVVLCRSSWCRNVHFIILDGNIMYPPYLKKKSTKRYIWFF
jgi:hypothetical protein